MKRHGAGGPSCVPGLELLALAEIPDGLCCHKSFWGKMQEGLWDLRANNEQCHQQKRKTRGEGTEREKMEDSLYQLIKTCLSEEVALGLLRDERGAIDLQFVEKKKYLIRVI